LFKTVLSYDFPTDKRDERGVDEKHGKDVRSSDSVGKTEKPTKKRQHSIPVTTASRTGREHPDGNRSLSANLARRAVIRFDVKPFVVFPLACVARCNALVRIAVRVARERENIAVTVITTHVYVVPSARRTRRRRFRSAAKP
jgi:hypothetical protein